MRLVESFPGVDVHGIDNFIRHGAAFGFPVWVNRCGVIGGPGQLGRIDQGIFSFWIYSCALGRPLQYIGFGGTGRQVRDCILAEDIAELVIRQISKPEKSVPRILNVGGGPDGALSLREIPRICEEEFGHAIQVGSCPNSRPYDIPYDVTDFRRAQEFLDWRPSCRAPDLVTNLCQWSLSNMDFIRGLFP